MVSMTILIIGSRPDDVVVEVQGEGWHKRLSTRTFGIGLVLHEFRI